MTSDNKDNKLLRKIREGQTLTHNETLKLIIQLSIPSILAQISFTLMFFIDASMVGELGTKASAAIGLVESSTWLFGSLGTAAAMGFAVQVAHFIGANDFTHARSVFRQGITSTLIFSLIFMSLCLVIADPLPIWLGGGNDIKHDASWYFAIYSTAIPFLQMNILSSSMLKCSGNMKTPSIVSVFMCIADVLFNSFLIFPTREVEIMGTHLNIYGAGLGVPGAALGSMLAIALSSIFLLYYTTHYSQQLSINKEKGSFRPSRKTVINATKISTPMAGQCILMSGAQIASTMIVAPLGNIAIAANTFAITAESLCYMPGYGIGEAGTTLIGQSLGAGHKQLTMNFARQVIIFGMIVMAVMGAVMYITAPQMIGVMTPVEEIRSLAIEVLRIEAFAEPMFAASIVGYYVCLGAGDTLIPAFMNLGSMWFIRITSAAIFAPTYGLVGVWYAMAAELMFRGLIFIVRVWRGKWMDKMHLKKENA